MLLAGDLAVRDRFGLIPEDEDDGIGTDGGFPVLCLDHRRSDVLLGDPGHGHVLVLEMEEGEACRGIRAVDRGRGF